MWFAAAQDCQLSLAGETVGNATALAGGVVGMRVDGTEKVGEDSRCWGVSVSENLWVGGTASVAEEANFVFLPLLFKLVTMMKMITAMAPNATRPAHDSPAISRMGLRCFVGAAGKDAGAKIGWEGRRVADGISAVGWAAGTGIYVEVTAAIPRFQASRNARVV